MTLTGRLGQSCAHDARFPNVTSAHRMNANAGHPAFIVRSTVDAPVMLEPTPEGCRRLACPLPVSPPRPAAGRIMRPATETLQAAFEPIRAGAGCRPFQECAKLRRGSRWYRAATIARCAASSRYRTCLVPCDRYERRAHRTPRLDYAPCPTCSVA